MNTQPNHEWEGGEFTKLYHEWMLGDRADEQLRRPLLDTYQDSWRAGGSVDRYYIAYFIWQADVVDAVDLLVEGIYDEDLRVAEAAALAAMVCRTRDQFDTDRLDLRVALHDLVRRWPLHELIRHGYHLREGEGPDDSDERPFVRLFECWTETEPHDAEMTHELAATFREAWAHGDGIDKAFVILFLNENSLQEDPELKTDGRRLIVEAIQTDDPRLAPVAALMVSSYIERGDDLGPNLREILKSHRERFPQQIVRSGHIDDAIRILDKYEAREE